MVSTVTEAPPAAERTRLRVLVVEDHEMMREALDRRLTAGGFEVVAMVGSVASAVASYAELHPDLVLSDHSLPDGSGMDVLRSIKKVSAAAVVVMLSAHDDPALITSYLSGGANGYAHKTVAAPELVRILLAAAAGQPALDQVATSSLLARLQEPNPAELGSPLSRRETEVLKLVEAGCTNDDIASRLYISPQTVKTHLSRIFGKLGVRDRASAASKAIREHMLD